MSARYNCDVHKINGLIDSVSESVRNLNVGTNCVRNVFLFCFFFGFFVYVDRSVCHFIIGKPFDVFVCNFFLSLHLIAKNRVSIKVNR